MTEPGARSVRVGVEIGGTFTDLVAIDDDGTLSTCKVLSVPPSPAEGALAALDTWGERLDGVEVLVHGSTIATNTVLERTGATTALVVTEGFRDVLEIQRHERTRVYDLYYRKAVPIVPRHLVLEVDERIAADGSVVRPLGDTGRLLGELGRLIEEEHVESVTVVLLNSYRNAMHEEALGRAIRDRFPQVPVSTSVEVLPQFREYERASTTVMSAYLKPVIQRYMDTLRDGLSARAFDGDLHIMQSNGGIFPVAAAQQQAVNVILSGPAAGVVGATRVAAAAGYRNIITLDMGGTSTDVCLVHDGTPRTTVESHIDGLPIVVPMVEIITVGAGGGSIAYVDPGGMLKVGPASAGADPGPSCYGRGGVEPTVTDANVLCGLIRPAKFFGGNLRLRSDLASTALSHLAGALDMEPGALAEGIVRVANSNMMDAIRLASLERGHDPRDYALVAFGGAGGLHACSLAEDLEIGTVLVPRHPGLLSAYGLLVSDFRREFVRTELTSNADVGAERVLRGVCRAREPGPAGVRAVPCLQVGPRSDPLGRSSLPRAGAGPQPCGRSLARQGRAAPSRRRGIPRCLQSKVRTLLPRRRGRGRELSADRDRAQRSPAAAPRRREWLAARGGRRGVHGRSSGRLRLLRAAAASGRVHRERTDGRGGGDGDHVRTAGLASDGGQPGQSRAHLRLRVATERDLEWTRFASISSPGPWRAFRPR